MTKMITKDMIVLDMEAKDKEDVIRKLSKIIEDTDRLIDLDGYIKQVKEREATYPTSIGFDVAIPHGKCDSVKTAGVAFARLKSEIAWSEEENVRYVFLIAVPEKEAGDTHLKILAQLSRKIMREEFRNDLEKANDVDKVLELLEL
ncbi:PTS sugar transporter subunit IIA [Haloimpatiens sp. FM7330]|uniref:PTS sugar transporter subunit IIA n=1 Tax=Haloimpatiens sp. FM7330 TaxID=3298610 RepID=UPI0036307395